MAEELNPLLLYFKNYSSKFSKDGMTVRELAKILGICERTVGKMVRDAVERGDMQFSGFKYDNNIIGIPQRRPVYTIVQKGKK